MKIQYCSDLHLEFPENKKYLLENPIIPTAEILLLAGDIIPFTVLDKHLDFITYLSDHFKMVFWIPGNHEYYYSDINERTGSFEEKIRENVFLLNNKVKEIENTELIFSTLWSKVSEKKRFIIQQSLSDFRIIKKGNRLFNTEDYNELYQENLDFLKNVISSKNDSKKIVITHHVPTFLHYPDQYKDSIINEAFAVELEDVIKRAEIDYWIYGHHHSNTKDFTIGHTKLITNQLGYVKYGENVGFRSDTIIDIDGDKVIDN